MSIILAIFIVITFYDTAAAVVSLFFLFKKRTTEPSGDQADEVTIVILIPLLREQATSPHLIRMLANHLEHFSELRVVFVTTEREQVEVSRGEKTTMEVIQLLLHEYPQCKNKIFHLHFPRINKVIAEQLNYGLNFIKNRPEWPASNTYVMLLNADSIVASEAFAEVINLAKQGVPVIQQSSLFLSNVPMLLRAGAIIEAAHGVYQSCWTLAHEIPRYLAARCFHWWRMPQGSALIIAHCVGHGLTIKISALDSIGSFYENGFGGEDLAFGVALQMKGTPITPGKILENAQTPIRFCDLEKQLSAWFLATTGYVAFAKYALQASPTRLWAARWQALLGLVDAMRWLVKGPLILWMFYEAIVNHALLWMTGVYLLYCYGPLIVLIILWQKLPRNLFPKPPVSDIVKLIFVYPIIPIIRSLPAFFGVIIRCSMALGRPYVRPRTDKANLG